MGTKAVGAVGMQMRQQHVVDAVGSTPGGGGVLHRASSRALLISSGLNGTVTMFFGM